MMPDSQPDVNTLFMKFVGQFLGCLCVTYVRLDKDGKDIGEPETCTYSGFFIKLGTQWFLTTAGHVFVRYDSDNHGNRRYGLQQAVNMKAIRIVGASIIDYFGTNAKVQHPTVIDYDGLMNDDYTVFLNMTEDCDNVLGQPGDSLNLGLDFALLPLRNWYVSSISANGVVPFEESNWHAHNGTNYYVVGFPEELKSPFSYSDPRILGTIRQMGYEVVKCGMPSGIPTPPYDCFAAKLVGDQPASAVGLSGSPIIAARVTPQKTTQIWLAGIDVAWYKDERIILGCPMPYVIESYRKLMAYRPS